MTRTHCDRAMPDTATFCAWCGARLAEPPRYTLAEALDLLQLHWGHDYRERVVLDGVITGVRMLGASEPIVERLRAMVPGLVVVERLRRPGVGDPAAWLRVDVDVLP